MCGGWGGGAERTEPREETGEEQEKGRRLRKVNREAEESGCGFVPRERREKVGENRDMKENVGSPNMRGRKLHRGNICPACRGPTLRLCAPSFLL